MVLIEVRSDRCTLWCEKQRRRFDSFLEARLVRTTYGFLTFYLSPTKPSISILPLTNVSSEVAHTYGALFASIHYSAFSPLEMHQSIFRNVAKEDFIALGTKRFTKLIETSEEKGVVVLMAFKDDEPLGVAYWTLPKAQIVGGTGEDPPSVRPFAPGTKEEIASDFFLRLDAHCADRSHPPHYGLAVSLSTDA